MSRVLSAARGTSVRASSCGMRRRKGRSSHSILGGSQAHVDLDRGGHAMDADLWTADCHRSEARRSSPTRRSPGFEDNFRFPTSRHARGRRFHRNRAIARTGSV